MNLRSRLVLIAASLLVPVMVTACSLPADERVNQIGPDDLGPELANPTTTTTTTTVPQTTVPTVSADPSASEPTTTTTTLTPIQTRPVTVYYTIGSTESIAPVDLQLSVPVSLNLVQQALESPRPDVRDQELQTAVRPGLIVDTNLERATLNVTLDATTFQIMTETQRRRAINQMVLTFTSFTTPDRGAIGFVLFIVDGAPISVVLPSTQTSSEPGVPLAFDDFRSLLGGSTDTTTTTSPTTTAVTTPTTDPPLATDP